MLKTLSSLVMVEDMNEELEEMLKVSFENLSATDFALQLRSLLCGFLKFSVMLIGGTWCTTTTTVDAKILRFGGKRCGIDELEALSLRLSE